MNAKERHDLTSLVVRWERNAELHCNSRPTQGHIGLEQAALQLTAYLKGVHTAKAPLGDK